MIVKQIGEEKQIEKYGFNESGYVRDRESSEHLLSESGSTEYILGRDSDKIPQWMLEKDEEEEIRKRTPSPSISSTSTTSTTDSDSTFVRGGFVSDNLIDVKLGGCNGLFITS
ncbi:uncharacterized protein MONOS_17410 [Monocercomonoides exilis]|uniref:uncharacterized protein n=1 Tax=Monocercomonoides exilis TaxID=2049356 RepID=UPI003559A5F1|nr:hypothetical protein MONOS_17410 [Monocercomonoides exilis]